MKRLWSGTTSTWYRGSSGSIPGLPQRKIRCTCFPGILICGCCGCRMTRKTNHYKGREYHYYYCPTGKKGGCNGSVMLKEEDLIECVRDSLKGHIDNVASLDALLSGISQERINRELAQEYAGQIAANEKRMAKIEGFKTKLYENLGQRHFDERGISFL